MDIHDVRRLRTFLEARVYCLGDIGKAEEASEGSDLLDAPKRSTAMSHKALCDLVMRIKVFMDQTKKFFKKGPRGFATYC